MKPSNGLDSKPEVLREMSPEVECGDEVDDIEDEGGVGRSSARIEGETRRSRARGRVEGKWKPSSCDPRPKLTRKVATKSRDGG